MEENIECEGFIFYNNFDSANLAKVEKVKICNVENGKNENNKSHRSSSTNELPSYEFNIWTKPDCHGTEFQNNNKTWFYFGIKAVEPSAYVKLNIVNLNKQEKMFSQGMCPVFKVIPGHPHWERIREKPTYNADDKNNEFILSFNYRASENLNAITYVAFTYPFSYTDLQNYLKKIDLKMSKNDKRVNFPDDIYYHRECGIKSLEGRRLDILTISSYYKISLEREAKIKYLFPEEKEERPFKFYDKKIIFISARVHPGETPSTFVLNGFLNFLLRRDDQIAIALRRMYVFKLIPMLNPDGVANGYYRMDTKGVNLNRLYLNPSKIEHPTIYAAKMLLKYYHNCYSLTEDNCYHFSEENVPEITDQSNLQTFDAPVSITPEVANVNFSSNSLNSISKETSQLLQRVTLMSIEEKNKRIEQGSRVRSCLAQTSEKSVLKNQSYLENQTNSIESLENIQRKKICSVGNNALTLDSKESGIFLYIDFHGHASKKGIFMYGNHFDDPEDASSCMLLPKLMSINNSNFHFTSCNFAEKNMYLIDKRDGMSREGSGRVAVYKLFGLIHSYTLECNYNTGRIVNSVPGRIRESINKTHKPIFAPPKYTPSVFEEVGAALGPSILDMTNSNPNSRLPNSQYRSLKGLRSYLKLISTNHYQTLNKPLNKSDDGDQVVYSEDSTVKEFVKKGLKPKTATSKLQNRTSNEASNSRKKNHAKKIYTSIQNMKNNKKSSQVIEQNVRKRPPRINKRKNNVFVSKALKKDLKSKPKMVMSMLSKIHTNAKHNYFIKTGVSNKEKVVEKYEKNLPMRDPKKKGLANTEKILDGKQGSHKLVASGASRNLNKFKAGISVLSEKKNTKDIKIAQRKQKVEEITNKNKHHPKPFKKVFHSKSLI